MKPCDQTCPKCGALPKLLYREAEESGGEVVYLSGRVVYRFQSSPPLPERINCQCPRCRYSWSVNPIEATADETRPAL